MTTTFAFIFARGGSKGIPKKNLSLLGGVPLLSHSIRAALSNQYVQKTFVSSDCPEILDTAFHEGAIPIHRPLYLAHDSSPELESWKHAVSFVIKTYGQFDQFISLPCTSPLRSQADINSALLAHKKPFDLVMTMTPSSRSPWFNMVQQDSSGKITQLIQDQTIFRRQDAPASFDLTTVAYVTSPNYILECSTLWDGTVTAIEVPQARSVDIDTPFDLMVAELLFTKTNEQYDSK